MVRAHHFEGARRRRCGRADNCCGPGEDRRRRAQGVPASTPGGRGAFHTGAIACSASGPRCPINPSESASIAPRAFVDASFTNYTRITEGSLQPCSPHIIGPGLPQTCLYPNKVATHLLRFSCVRPLCCNAPRHHRSTPVLPKRAAHAALAVS